VVLNVRRAAAGPILLLDPDEPGRLSLTGVLEDEGYFVLGAGSARAGLAVLEDFRPALVLLVGPGPDERQLVDDVRAQGIRFVLCLLGGDEDSQQWADALGVPVVSNPYGPDQVITLVQEVIGPAE
jgi:DNA-binding response OmpR family regulator